MTQQIIQTYLTTFNKRFKSGISREHAYRAGLEGLIREVVPGVEVTNEPANVTDCGNPDFVVTRQGVWPPTLTCRNRQCALS
ncbi:MAG: hypothetical protein JXA33_10155 [Anaerolineae bacterium]|nr:hypothetical protein [Anaerolineae bacterium]